MTISVILCRISYIAGGVINWYFFPPILSYTILIRSSLPLLQWKCSWKGHWWLVCCYTQMVNSVLILCDPLAAFDKVGHYVFLNILLSLVFWTLNSWSFSFLSNHSIFHSPSSCELLMFECPKGQLLVLFSSLHTITSL